MVVFSSNYLEIYAINQNTRQIRFCWIYFLNLSSILGELHFMTHEIGYFAILIMPNWSRVQILLFPKMIGYYIKIIWKCQKTTKHIHLVSIRCKYTHQVLYPRKYYHQKVPTWTGMNSSSLTSSTSPLD